MALFLIAAVLLGLLGLDGLWMILGALVISSIASIFLLRNQRAALSERVAQRVDERHFRDGDPNDPDANNRDANNPDSNDRTGDHRPE
jgi:UPF0716 family protein affecting phage T7 exclusion